MIAYEEAMAEVERILERIQQQEVSVDELSREVGRAAALIASCRERLLKAEQEVTEILEQS